MQFQQTLLQGTFLRRYKRFFVDVELDSGELVTAHSANTGSMKTALGPGFRVALSYHPDPKRKLPYSLELSFNGQSWIGVNTHLPNSLVAEALQARELPVLGNFSSFQREVKINEASRLDFALDYPQGPRGFLEVKNVSMADTQKKLAMFPDAVSERARKHLRELTDLHQLGHPAFCLFIVQREDVGCFQPARDIDPLYAEAFYLAQASGVRMLAYQFAVSPKGISLKRSLEILEL